MATDLRTSTALRKLRFDGGSLVLNLTATVGRRGAGEEHRVERLDGEVPAYYVDFIRQDVGREFMQSLEKQGTNLQQWMIENSINGDDMKAEIAEEAARRAAIDCALEALYAKKGWELSDEDIDGMFAGEETPGETRAAWEAAHRMADVRKMCRQSKATDWLVDTAVVTVVDQEAQE